MLRTSNRFHTRFFVAAAAFVGLALTATITVSQETPPTGEEPPKQAAEAQPAQHADFVGDHLHHPWVDSVMESLTPRERIAQLFMVAAYSNKDQAHVNSITKLVEETKIGGLIFFQGGPMRQAKLTNLYQSKAQTPLMIAIDGEWGLAMRLDSTIKYPRQMTLGAIQNDSIVYAMGRDIALQCKRMGIHVNFAPVVDVNNNPNNPVIGSRSFGEDKYNVARKGIAYMKGMQDQHILTTAKHFPGHGDTDTDSHKALPTITHNKERLYDLELYPFRELMKAGLGGTMVAHLNIPALDSTSNDASTLSKPIVTGILKEEMGFDGLIFTDALNMKGVSAYFKPGVVDRKALVAGNDVLLFAEDVPTAIGQIENAITSGEITQEEIDSRVRKILAAKHWCGAHKNTQIELKGLAKDLNDPKYQTVQRELAKASVTLLKNEGALVPFDQLSDRKIASVSIGVGSKTVFQTTMDSYADVKHFSLGKAPSALEISRLRTDLKGFDVCVISIHNTNERHWKNYGISSEAMDLVNKVKNDLPVALALFANPYSLNKFYGVETLPVVVMGYQDRAYQQEYAAQLLFGGIPGRGKLPVSASEAFGLGAGLASFNTRFEFTVPEAAGLSSEELARIDAIVENGIKEQAFPGCQVVVARKGKVVYRKSYGHHTYEAKRKVKDSDIYDLASITKIASSTLSLMYLHDRGQFSLDRSLCDYLPELVNGTPYGSMNLRDMLAHQAGLVPWIPFYTNTLVKGQPRYDVYSMAQSELYPHRVAENLYIHKEYPDSLVRQILAKPLRADQGYKYSDLGYYFVQRIIEKQSGQSLDDFTYNTFYKPMGLRSVSYKPREHHDLHEIVPTEYDMAFRKQLVHGDVHDPGAAMMGGVGGHAGLFANATDLAALMQMIMDWGSYGGQDYLEESTVKDFIRCQFCDVNGNGNRRGAGFDKPVRNSPGGPTCNCVSYNSFGHSGFTGTLVWADPDEEIVYVFLSNRVYPSATNKKLITMGIRTDIQQVIYDALHHYRNNQSGTISTNLPVLPRPEIQPNPADTMMGPAGR